MPDPSPLPHTHSTGTVPTHGRDRPLCRPAVRCWLLSWILAATVGHLSLRSETGPVFRTNDVVAWVGGAAVVSADQSGEVELALTLSHPGYLLRFRSLAFEGDTVHALPRDLNFPSLPESLRSAGATVTCVQFGALECFAGREGLPAFQTDLGRRLDEIAEATPRIVVVVPPPFETKPPPLPDLGRRNPHLALYAAALRSAATARSLPVVDLFEAFQRPGTPPSWTQDGRELSPTGRRFAAAAWARASGRPDLAEPLASEGFWRQPPTVSLHAAVRARSRLWFDYWRPMNWAFLHGDRTDQLSSRDHLDPSKRWFPEEMQQFLPLIAEAEVRIQSLARQHPAALAP